MRVFSTFMELLVSGAAAIKSFLTIDFSEYLGGLGDFLSMIGIDLNGISLIGLIGGVGLFALVLYSIIK